jgi:epoxyqueuosine reductase
MQDWVFGCDICQDVCPVNRKAQAASQPITAAGQGGALLDLVDLLEMSDEGFRSRFAGTSIMRAKRVGMQRNACVALGNLGDAKAVPSLCTALRDPDPLVRGHAAWALGRIGGQPAVGALAAAAGAESDPSVLEEIRWAQAHSGGA